MPKNPAQSIGTTGTPQALVGRLADGLDIVADQRGDAGVVDENGGRRVVVDRLLDRMEKPLLAPAHDHVLLGEVGRHTDPVELRAGGTRAPVVPKLPAQAIGPWTM